MEVRPADQNGCQGTVQYKFHSLTQAYKDQVAAVTGIKIVADQWNISLHEFSSNFEVFLTTKNDYSWSDHGQCLATTAQILTS